MTVEATLRAFIQPAIPEIVLAATACVLFIVGAFWRVGARWACVGALLGLGGAIAAGLVVTIPAGAVPGAAALWSDGFGDLVRWLAVGGGILLVIVQRIGGTGDSSEYYGLLLLATAGVSLVGRANDLIVLYLALELISIPTYVMLWLSGPREAACQEAATKYFLLSIMSSAFMVFGFSYLYGIAGSTNVTVLGGVLPSVILGDYLWMASTALVMVMVGLGFRMTAFPFHFYAPDVYQGSGPGMVAVLSYYPKVAGLAALMRLLAHTGWGPIEYLKQVVMLVWVLAAGSLLVGSAMGLWQRHLRRLLAYSGVVHAGFLLIGLAAFLARSDGRETEMVGSGGALLFYVAAYGLAGIGALAVLSHLEDSERRIEAIDDLSGLRETHPWSAALLGLLILSLMGMPLTAGFIGKLLIVMGALTMPGDAPFRERFVVLAVIAIIGTATSAVYYLRVLNAIFLRSSLQPPQPRERVSGALLAAWICAAGVVVGGLLPSWFLKQCAEAAKVFGLPGLSP